MADETKSAMDEEKILSDNFLNQDLDASKLDDKANTQETKPLSSPVKSEKSIEITPESSSTPTAESCQFDDLPHDMVSSYTEISFGGGDSDIDLLDECQEMNEEIVLDPNDDTSKQVGGRLSLPTLSSTIVNWSEKARAEYDLEYDKTTNANKSPTDKIRIKGDYIHKRDDKISFVVADLEKKLQLSAKSPTISRATSGQVSPTSTAACQTPTRTPSIASSSAPFVPPPLAKLEAQAKLIAKNVDHIMHNISDYTHQVTELTVDCTRNFEKSLNSTCDSIDSNIKSMYQLIAKFEELSDTMTPIDHLCKEVQDIKKVLIQLEKEMGSNRY